MYEINICHLYPELLNLYGDRGNIITLKKRCDWRGIAANMINVSIGDKFQPELYDIVFIGGGQDYEQEIIKNDLLLNKGNEIKNAIENGMVFLCICGGYQIMGEYYLTVKGTQIKFLGALNIWTHAGEKRLTGNLIFNCEFLQTEHFDGTLVGFENHSGRTYIGPSVRPLGKVVKGFGNNGEDGSEGAIYKNTFCSYSHGSLLPKNPNFADHLLAIALKRKYKDFIAFGKLDDSLETAARNAILTRLM